MPDKLDKPVRTNASESSLERRVVAAAIKNGIMPIKLTQVGWPDRVFFRGGKTAFIEFKSAATNVKARAKLTPNQKRVLDKLAGDDFDVAVCGDFDEAMGFLIETLGGHNVAAEKAAKKARADEAKLRADLADKGYLPGKGKQSPPRAQKPPKKAKPKQRWKCYKCNKRTTKPPPSPGQPGVLCKPICKACIAVMDENIKKAVAHDAAEKAKARAGCIKCSKPSYHKTKSGEWFCETCWNAAVKAGTEKEATT